MVAMGLWGVSELAAVGQVFAECVDRFSKGTKLGNNVGLQYSANGIDEVLLGGSFASLSRSTEPEEQNGPKYKEG